MSKYLKSSLFVEYKPTFVGALLGSALGSMAFGTIGAAFGGLLGAIIGYFGLYS